MDSNIKPIDNKLLNLLKLRIYTEERNNYRTQKHKNTEMVDLIRKIIEREVDKNEN